MEVLKIGLKSEFLEYLGYIWLQLCKWWYQWALSPNVQLIHTPTSTHLRFIVYVANLGFI